MVDDERFAPTSGRISGVIGLIIAVMILGYAFIPDDPDIEPWGIAAALLLAAVSWTALLKPGLSITAGHLVIRNMFATVTIPLHRIDSVAVRQFTAVQVDEKRFVSPAVGRSRTQLNRDNPRPGPSKPNRSRTGGLGFGAFGLSAHTPDVGQGDSSTRGAPKMSYGFYVEEKIRRAISDTKRHRSGTDEPGEVQRRIAWLEVVLVTGTVVATVLLVVL